MTVRQDVQARLSLQKKTLGNSRSVKIIMAEAYIAIIILTLAATVVATSILFSYNAEAQRTVASQVLVGGGNATYPFFGYNPQEVRIKAGGSVVWSVPSKAPLEAHTVTFVF